MLTRSRIYTLFSLALFASSLSVYAEDASLQQQISALTKKIDELEQKTSSNSESINSIVSSKLKKAIQFHGFASFGLSQLSESGLDESYYNGQSSTLSVLPNTWLGLQMNAKLYNGGEVVAQVVSKGSNDNEFALDMEWLFLKQNLGANFTAQLGRIRFPAFIDSEVVYIGNTYPTVATPAEIYSVLPINHIDGGSISHALSFGDWTLDSKAVIWGQSSEDYEGYTLSLDKIHGLSFNLSEEALSLRIGVFKAEENIEITDPVFAANFGDQLTYATSAIRYDNQQCYFSTEGIIIKNKDDLLDENRNWNITTGYYFGQVLAYIGHSRTRVTNVDELTDALSDKLGIFPHPLYGPLPAGIIYAPFLNRQQNANMAGIKYDFTRNATLKFQVQYLNKFEGTQGNFATKTAKLSFDHMYVYDIAVQAHF